MFKKNKISIGVAAGVLGVTAMMTSAQAVYVDKSVYANPDGTGQVLLFPYYNANPGYVTNVNIVNSTDDTKAVRIRFREGRNSEDVMDFNLYMSPNDVWTGSVQYEGGHAKIVTEDKTCTYPTSIAPYCKSSGDCSTGEAQQFKGISATDDDTLEGYIEVVEMGVIPPDATTLADGNGENIAHGVEHNNGQPNSEGCKVVSELGAWKPGNGAFRYGGAIEAPKGGLFGSSAVVNPEKGTAFAIDPVAIENYSRAAQHTKPDDPTAYMLPSLASGDVYESSTFSQNGNEFYITRWNPLDNCDNPAGCNPFPISHALLAPHLMNEFFVDPKYDGKTDWVVTTPMKKYGVCDDSDGNNICNDKDKTIINWDRGIYSREEQPVLIENASPVLPEALTREVTVFNYSTSYKNDDYPNYVPAKSVFSSQTAHTVPVTNFLHGWARMSFGSGGDYNTTSYNIADQKEWCESFGPNATGDCDSSIFEGVPAIGFAALEGNVSGGANTRFGDALPHKVQRDH